MTKQQHTDSADSKPTTSTGSPKTSSSQQQHPAAKIITAIPIELFTQKNRDSFIKELKIVDYKSNSLGEKVYKGLGSLSPRQYELKKFKNPFDIADLTHIYNPKKLDLTPPNFTSKAYLAYPTNGSSLCIILIFDMRAKIDDETIREDIIGLKKAALTKINGHIFCDNKTLQNSSFLSNISNTFQKTTSGFSQMKPSEFIGHAFAFLHLVDQEKCSIAQGSTGGNATDGTSKGTTNQEQEYLYSTQGLTMLSLNYLAPVLVSKNNPDEEHLGEIIAMQVLLQQLGNSIDKLIIITRSKVLLQNLDTRLFSSLIPFRNRPKKNEFRTDIFSNALSIPENIYDIIDLNSSGVYVPIVDKTMTKNHIDKKIDAIKHLKKDIHKSMQINNQDIVQRHTFLMSFIAVLIALLAIMDRVFDYTRSIWVAVGFGAVALLLFGVQDNLIRRNINDIIILERASKKYD